MRLTIPSNPNAPDQGEIIVEASVLPTASVYIAIVNNATWSGWVHLTRSQTKDLRRALKQVLRQEQDAMRAAKPRWT